MVILGLFDYQDRHMLNIRYKERKLNLYNTYHTSLFKKIESPNRHKRHCHIFGKDLTLPINALNKIEIVRRYVISKVKWRFSICNLTETWVSENTDKH